MKKDNFYYHQKATNFVLSSYNHLQKILKKLRKLTKSCNQKRNINIIYNEKLHYNYFQHFADFET